MLVEKELDLLIGDVDAELLEGVAREVLETENVEQADRKRFAAVGKQMKSRRCWCLLPPHRLLFT